VGIAPVGKPALRSAKSTNGRCASLAADDPHPLEPPLDLVVFSQVAGGMQELLLDVAFALTRLELGSPRHCEEPCDEAIHTAVITLLHCVAALAMTMEGEGASS
jgi:hypothetical protein